MACKRTRSTAEVYPQRTEVTETLDQGTLPASSGRLEVEEGAL
jgi:hypothetical protein